MSARIARAETRRALIIERPNRTGPQWRTPRHGERAQGTQGRNAPEERNHGKRKRSHSI